MRSVALTCIVALGMCLTPSTIVAAETPATTTSAFVAMCDGPTASTKCILEFQMVDAANDWTDDPKSKNCAPISEFGDTSFHTERDQIKRVVAWLKQHHKLMNQSDTNGVGAALRALYPCK